MEVSNIGSIGIGNGFVQEKTAVQSQNASNAAFEDFFNAALSIYRDTNEKELTVEKMQKDFATGKTDDYLGMIMAQEEAHASLQFTVQVTNKIIEAYKEIMRIQV